MPVIVNDVSIKLRVSTYGGYEKEKKAHNAHEQITDNQIINDKIRLKKQSRKAVKMFVDIYMSGDQHF